MRNEVGMWLAGAMFGAMVGYWLRLWLFAVVVFQGICFVSLLLVRCVGNRGSAT